MRLHRWFGLIMCLFFAAWFLSGFVMMYVDFPQYSRKERLSQQAPLSLGSCHFIPAGLSQRLMQDTAWKSIRLNMLLNRPVFRLENNHGETYTFFADDGSQFTMLSAEQARGIAMNYLSGSRPPVRLEKITALDQWIPRSAYLVHMPIYRISMNDPAGTVVYISSRTGEILQVHNFSQRVLAWCGPIIHWIYPKELILRRPLWRFVVILFSSLGIVASIAGIAAGLIRVKRKNKSYVSPYRDKWFRWHHYTGFVFGLFTFTWVFSGLLTMSPFGWSPELDITAAGNTQLQGGNLMMKSFTRTPAQAFALLKDQFQPVEIELRRFQGRNYYTACDAYGKTQNAAADTEGDRDSSMPFRYFPSDQMIAAIQSLQGEDPPSKISMIRSEDSYYYSKHNDNILPVLRVQYTDAGNTWYYADPSTGIVLFKNNRSSRTSRWLYHGLHSLDFFNLQHHRPIWDIIMCILLTGGTAVSLTGLVMGLKKLFHNYL